MKEADDIAYDQLQELLKTKQSIVVDGITDSRAARAQIAQSARSAGYETLVVWVQTEPTTAKNRSGRPSADTNNRVLKGEAYDKAAQLFVPPSAPEKIVVISGKHTYATQAKVILKKLSEPRATISLHTTAPVRPDPTGRRNITIR